MNLFHYFFRLAQYDPSAAKYFTRQKCLTNLSTLINYFGEGYQMVKIVDSPKIDMQTSIHLLTTAHEYFASFQNRHLPLKESSLEYNPNNSDYDNCKMAILRTKEMLKLIKTFVDGPSIIYFWQLHELCKLSEDLIGCIHAYVDLLQ